MGSRPRGNLDHLKEEEAQMRNRVGPQQVVHHLGAPPEPLLSLCARRPSFYLPILNWCQTFSCFLIQTLGILQLRWLSQLDSEDSYIYAPDKARKQQHHSTSDHLENG